MHEQTTPIVAALPRAVVSPAGGAPQAGTLPLAFSWDYDFKHPVADVWEIVTNTERLNRAAGLPAIRYSATPDPAGGSIRHGETTQFGFPLRWLEHPYEWVLHHFFRNERTYERGPIKRLISHWVFTSYDGGVRMRQTISVEPAHWVGRLASHYEIGTRLRQQFTRAYAWIDDYLGQRVSVAFRPTGADIFKAPPGMRGEILERLAVAGVAPSLSSRAADLISKGQPAELKRLRPFRLAKQWGVSTRAALSLFLRGTHGGLFVMQWDLICPSCRGAKQRVTNLSDVTAHASCDSCNIKYDVDFERGVELTFEIHPSLREVDVNEYCVGGPQNTPHYLTQLRIPPGQSRTGKMSVDEGVFIVRSAHSGMRYRLNVLKNAAPVEGLLLEMHPDATQDVEINIPPGPCAFSIKNAGLHEMLVMFERAAWLEDVCTAAYITSLQEFRNLFAAQVVRSGERISVGAMTLLFTDLRGSTAMYERMGDSSAFGLVRDHFKILMQEVEGQGGCVVKTIGDAVMAAFNQPKAAVVAAIKIQQRIQALPKNADVPSLVLKIGLHYGPCLAVNLNDRLDYFGTAVNVAARTEGQCEGNDIVLSGELFLQQGVEEAISSAGMRCERFRRTLKGLHVETELIRVRFT